jgi:hypothetical protein
MRSLSGSIRLLLAFVAIIALNGFAVAQRAVQNDSDFGPVMTAYLGYLNNEQEVVDDRASRKEISVSYYRRNSNRISALRQMAVNLVRHSGNDYVPELEAVTTDEFGTIFETPPRPATLHQHEVFANKFRYLGTVRAGETFYLFARLDPYEQAELVQRSASEGNASLSSGNSAPSGQRVGQSSSRPRRVVPH